MFSLKFFVYLYIPVSSIVHTANIEIRESNKKNNKDNIEAI